VTDHRPAGRERTWKLVSTVSGMLGAMVAKRLMRAGYHAMRRNTEPSATPFDRADARFSWPDALLWAAAAGVGLGVTKVVSARLAAFGWEVATGSAPPSAD
jgi:hypothetical protein